MLHDKETGIYKLRHVRLYLYLGNLFVQGLWTEEMQDYAKHNTQIDVIYNSLEQLYSGKKGKKIQQEKQTEGESGEGKGDGAWRHFPTPLKWIWKEKMPISVSQEMLNIFSFIITASCRPAC